jgi:hypothetical protein
MRTGYPPPMAARNRAGKRERGPRDGLAAFLDRGAEVGGATTIQTALAQPAGK